MNAEHIYVRTVVVSSEGEQVYPGSDYGTGEIEVGCMY